MHGLPGYWQCGRFPGSLCVFRTADGPCPKASIPDGQIECGLFADSIKDLDCVSIGPEMADVHTPWEHFSISSVQRTYALLREVLRESK